MALCLWMSFQRSESVLIQQVGQSEGFIDGLTELFMPLRVSLLWPYPSLLGQLAPIETEGLDLVCHGSKIHAIQWHISQK